MYGREKNQLKRPEQITSIVYFHVILFRMHERDTAREKEFDSPFPNDKSSFCHETLKCL